MRRTEDLFHRKTPSPAPICHENPLSAREFFPQVWDGLSVCGSRAVSPVDNGRLSS